MKPNKETERERKKKGRGEGEKSRAKGRSTSRLKRRKKIKHDKLGQQLFIFDVRELPTGKSVFCLATPVEG